MTDLFDWLPSYPVKPGYKEPTTSKAAAKAIEHRVEHLRDRVLTAISNAGKRGLTADEAASRIGETVLAVRPRVTELSMGKKIERTGERRPNASGVKADVWRARA